MEYTIKTINELCTKITDGSHFSPEHDENGVYPMYSSKDMLYDGFDDSDVKRISETVYKKLVKQDCRPLKNDILIIKDGNSYLKRIFKINTDIDAVILSSIAILRPNVKIINPDFFKYLLRSDSIRNAMANYVSGAAIPRIVLKDFKKMKLEFISSMKAQQKIASILSAYDNLIQNYKKQIETLQTAASELYKEWFVRFRFPGYQTTRFENGLPEGWKVEKLGNISNISAGGDKPKIFSDVKNESCCIPIYSNGIENNGLYGYTDKAEILEESVTISARGTVGFVCLREEPYVPIVRLLSVTPKKSSIKAKFLYYYLSNAHLEGNGTSQQQITIPMVFKRKIMLPSENLIDSFEMKVSPMFAKIRSLQQQITNLTQQRDLLLPRLMSGKLEV